MPEKQTRKRTPRATPSPDQGTKSVSHATKAESRGASLPVLVPELHVRHIPVPRVGIEHVPVPRVYVPGTDTVRRSLTDLTGNRALWYGGLAGLAVVGVIGWPVAGVVAAGTYVAEHRARAAARDGDSAGGHAGTGKAARSS